MSTRKILSRRTLLRGAVGGSTVALGLPLLDAMLPSASAAQPSAPPIFGLFFWANGTPWHGGHGASQGQSGYPDLWTPAEIGNTYTPPQLLAPLVAHNVTVISGLEPQTEIPEQPPGQSDGHMRGFMVALTGDRIRPDGFDHPSHTLTALRPTLDQYVAKHEQFYGAAPPRFRSLVLGVSDARFHDYGHWNAISYNGPDSLNIPISNPAQLHGLLFDVPADLKGIERRAKLLDAVLDDAESLRVRLGGADRIRLEEHLAHLDEIQRRLDLSAGTCDIAPPAPGDSGDLIARTEIIGQLLAVALQCDLTRVFSFMLTAPATTHVFSNLGVPDGMHKICHDGAWEYVRSITEHQMHAFARLLDQLAAAPDPMGTTLLDRSVIYATTEYGEGWQHGNKEHPLLLAGGGAGTLRRGAHVREPGGNLAKAQVTTLRALGLDTPSFGFSGAETSDEFSEILL